jgi:hypothetical protein
VLYLVNTASTRTFRPAILMSARRLCQRIFGSTGEERTIELPIQEHPFTLELPLWGDAGFLRSARIDDPFPEVHRNFYHWTPETLRQSLGLEDSERLEIVHTPRVDAKLFARAIAKIAYCHAVARYGLHGFRPLALPDIILGRSSTCAGLDCRR